VPVKRYPPPDHTTLLKQIKTIGDVIEMTTLAENSQKTQKDYESAEPWLQMMPQRQLNYYERPS
jgi:hypothetical protein